jgi:predicted GIY-YIG superfamily endonuclease
MAGHHLYRHFAADGELLYVGVSLSALRRLQQHQQRSPWFDHIARVEIQAFQSRGEALTAERQAIATERPTHNARCVAGPGQWQVEHRGNVVVFRAPGQDGRMVACREDALKTYGFCLRQSGVPEALWNSLLPSPCAPSGA